MTSLHSISSYRYASQAHTSYITSLARYGLLDNSLFQEYLTKIYYISLYVIIFTSLHYHHQHRTPRHAAAAGEGHGDGIHDTFALPSHLIKSVEEEEERQRQNTEVKGGKEISSFSYSSCLYEEDIIRLWESYHGVTSYMETMMRTGDNKELFLRLNFNELWNKEGSRPSLGGGGGVAREER